LDGVRKKSSTVLSIARTRETNLLELFREREEKEREREREGGG
jgi:hypothetical protein